MNKKILSFVVVIGLVFSLIGCTDSKQTIQTEGKVDNQEIEVNNEEEFLNEAEQEQEETEIVEIVKEGIPSPLSGIYGQEEKINRRPIAIMFDNFKTARWQAGLSQAEIVYEFLAEGKITRYMGIFLMNNPELIGPVRSARPYFITKSLEYDAVYVHCGGSPQAYEDIKDLNLADLDEIRNAGYAFFRYYETGKKGEHTLYTTMKKLRDAQNIRGYREIAKFDPFNFKEADEDIKGAIAESVLIEYFSNNTTKYVYDEEQKVYIRYKDGKLHIDEDGNQPIVAKNIIIQRAKTKVIDNDGRRKIDLIGEGTGIFITNGKSQEITWKKKDRKSKTKFYDENGSEIVLNPGVTWVQVVQLGTSITIE